MSSNTNDPWDPSRLTVACAPTATGMHRSPHKGASIQGPFIAGPITVSWIAKARPLGVTALWVALGLLHLKGLRRSNTFIVSNRKMEQWGVLPDAKSRALKSLERAGLIRVERRGKRNPIVTIVQSTAGDPSGGER